MCMWMPGWLRMKLTMDAASSGLSLTAGCGGGRRRGTAADGNVVADIDNDSLAFDAAVDVDASVCVNADVDSSADVNANLDAVVITDVDADRAASFAGFAGFVAITNFVDCADITDLADFAGCFFVLACGIDSGTPGAEWMRVRIASYASLPSESLMPNDAAFARSRPSVHAL
ncbi:hypothetical protein GQ42DRAFT_88479 [Ramicandelaber brevisporus]|nr:hypothetical protein GQ42DRAFT_88479 [Ramicandelaber brevisporus]